MVRNQNQNHLHRWFRRSNQADDVLLISQLSRCEWFNTLTNPLIPRFTSFIYLAHLVFITFFLGVLRNQQGRLGPAVEFRYQQWLTIEGRKFIPPNAKNPPSDGRIWQGQSGYREIREGTIAVTNQLQRFFSPLSSMDRELILHEEPDWNFEALLLSGFFHVEDFNSPESQPSNAQPTETHTTSPGGPSRLRVMRRWRWKILLVDPGRDVVARAPV